LAFFNGMVQEKSNLQRSVTTLNFWSTQVSMDHGSLSTTPHHVPGTKQYSIALEMASTMTTTNTIMGQLVFWKKGREEICITRCRKGHLEDGATEKDAWKRTCWRHILEWQVKLVLSRSNLSAKASLRAFLGIKIGDSCVLS
jgi:hypothetical protein